MEVKIKQDPNEQKDAPIDDVEQPELPLENEPAPLPDVAEEEAARVKALEIENAELRGRNSVLSSIPQTQNQVSNQNAWKQTVLSDMNNLADEDFRAKYKYEKWQAATSIVENDFNQADAQRKREISELRAENRMVAKYGHDYLAAKSHVDEMLDLASAEVRQDPEKLTKYLERAYLSAPKPTPKAPGANPPGKEAGVRRIVSSFEKPTPVPAGGNRNEPKNDELPDEYKALGRAMKITSEKERRELMSSNFVPMDLGGGLVFKDPAKGVEQIAKAG